LYAFELSLHELKATLSILVYYIAYTFMYMLSLLPFRVLYIFSDVLYVVLYYLIGYRKKIVLLNLRNSFPDKSEAELQVISRKFYHFLCDMFLESFKTLTISPKEMQEHCFFSTEAKQLFTQMAAENKSVMIVMGHYGNWEWGGNVFNQNCKHQLYVIYHPLANKHFDGLMYQMRTRFGTKLIPMKETFKVMLSERSDLSATAFIADQTPVPDHAAWIKFLNQDTTVFKGYEIIAKKLNYPVVYLRLNRTKRGYYEMRTELLCAQPKDCKDGEIIELFNRRLEQDIVMQPEYWLWTHRRWKHKPPVKGIETNI